MSYVITSIGRNSNTNLTEANTRTSYRHMDFIAKGVGATKTTTVIQGAIIGEQFGIGDEIYLKEIMRRYISGDFGIIVIWAPWAAEAAKEVRWQCDYKTAVVGDVVSGTTTLQSPDQDLETTQYKSQSYTFTIPEAALALNKHVACKISRIALVDGDNPATEPVVIDVLMQYTSEQIPTY